jgi:hypothetical protein
MHTHAEVNVAARDNFGHFIKEIELAGRSTVEDLVKEGARISTRLAPVGHRHDLRSIPLKQSIFHYMRGRTQGAWGSSARHAMFVEKDTRAHPIPGNPYLRFFWVRENRFWEPGLFGEMDVVNHPGTEAQPFLEPALHEVMRKWRRIAAKNYRKR